MRRPSRARLVAVLALLAAGACSESSTAPARGPVDLPTALSEMSLTSYLPAGATAGGAIPLSSVNAAGCAYNGSVQSFVCAPVTTAGLTINSSYTLLSSTGAPLAAFDAATTAAIRSTMTVNGTMGTGTSALQVDERQVMTLSGLLTGQHVLDGTQVAHLTGTVSTQRFDETITTTIAGLVPPDRPGAGAYPRAGTITMTIAGSTIATPSTSGITLVMKFNGTSKVDVTISGLGTTQHCVIDLAVASAAGLGCA